MFTPLLSVAVLLLPDPAALKVRVDSARHEVVLTIGPLHLGAKAAGESHAGMHAGGHDSPLLRFAWPVSGWARGFGVTGDGLLIRAGHPYRVVAIYQNPLGRILTDGGMAVLAGVFAPDDSALWPVLDRSDPGFLADLAALNRLGWTPIPPSGTSGHEYR